MKKIGFIGAFDKANFIMYIAKILEILNYNVLVVDTSCLQKMKYIIPSVNPTKSYITNFENIDFAIGFNNWEDIEKYLGIKFDSNDEEIDNKKTQDNKNTYDYILLDIDSPEALDAFDAINMDKKYFVTSFDVYSLKKGLNIFCQTENDFKLTKIMFSYEATKENEEYLNFVSLEYNVEWNEYTMYFQILGEDNKVFEENQRMEKIRFKRLSPGYKESLAYVIQDIDKNENIAKVKKAMKD